MKFLPITNELAASQRVRESEFLKDLCASVLAIYPGGKPVMPWAGYLVDENGTLVGTCAFKSPPVAEEVEIAYFTFSGHEGRGIATCMARHLVELAFENGIVRVKAQTLMEKNASTRLLEKLGFSFAGVVEHPEDGKVWEWHRVVGGRR